MKFKLFINKSYIFFKKKGNYFFFLTPLFLILFILSILYPLFPINADEAFNYYGISSKGPLFVLTYYSQPNNHVFFTLLQSLLVPTFILPSFPSGIRFLNILVVVVFFSSFPLFFSKFFKKNFYLLIPLMFLFFFSTPLVTPYFIVARGYFLGLILLLYGIYFLTQKRYFLSSFLFILSGWTLPTYAYSLPFVYLSLFIYSKKEERKKIFLSSIIVPLGLFLCYLPIINSLLTQSHDWGFRDNSIPKFFIGTIQTLNNFHYNPFGRIFSPLFLLLYCLSLIFLFKSKKHIEKNLFIFLLNSAICSYFTVIVIFSLTNVANPPFLRNGIFVPVFIFISMFFAFVVMKNNWLRVVFLVFFALNVFFGAKLIFSNIPLGTETSYYPSVYECTYSTVPDSDIKLLKEKKLKFIKSSWEGETFPNFYSLIYAIPLKIDGEKNSRY